MTSKKKAIQHALAYLGMHVQAKVVVEHLAERGVHVGQANAALVFRLPEVRPRGRRILDLVRIVGEANDLEEGRRAERLLRDRDQVLQADIFLFVLDGRVPDEGACVELGIAYGQKRFVGQDKLLIGLHTDMRAAFPEAKLNAMVAGAPPFEHIVDRVIGHANGLVLIGHYVGFDIEILRTEAQRCGRDWRPTASLDIMLLYAGLFPDRTALGLDDIAADLGIQVIGRHSALGDALTAGEIFVRLLVTLSERELTTLEAAQRLQQKTAKRLGIGGGASRAASIL